MFDWYRRCAYDGEQKKEFHRQARIALRALAKELRFPKSSYDLRSNRGGVAVSGEITLHHDRVYIQVCQPATGADSGILIRTWGHRRICSKSYSKRPNAGLCDPGQKPAWRPSS